MFILLSLLACKKEVTPEPAAEPVVIDVASSITVKVMSEGVTKVKAVCKDTGERAEVTVGDERTITLVGLTGDNCMLTFEPDLGSYSPVTGGQSWGCISEAGQDVGCKPL